MQINIEAATAAVTGTLHLQVSGLVWPFVEAARILLQISYAEAGAELGIIIPHWLDDRPMCSPTPQACCSELLKPAGCRHGHVLVAEETAGVIWAECRWLYIRLTGDGLAA